MAGHKLNSFYESITFRFCTVVTADNNHQKWSLYVYRILAPNHSLGGKTKWFGKASRLIADLISRSKMDCRSNVLWK